MCYLHTIYLLACKIEESSRNNLFEKNTISTRTSVWLLKMKRILLRGKKKRPRRKNAKYHERMHMHVFVWSEVDCNAEHTPRIIRTQFRLDSSTVSWHWAVTVFHFFLQQPHSANKRSNNFGYWVEFFKSTWCSSWICSQLQLTEGSGPVVVL